MAFSLGFGLRLWTPVLSPVHELFHFVIAAMGDMTITRIEWRAIYVLRPTMFFFIAPYFIELALYCWLVIRRKRLHWFSLGVACALILWAPGSLDFTRWEYAPWTFAIVWLLIVPALFIWSVMMYRYEKAGQ